MMGINPQKDSIQYKNKLSLQPQMQATLQKLHQHLHTKVSIAPLVVFRIAFGTLLFYSTIRTLQQGWVKELYIDPSYHFSFVSWIQPPGGNGMYIIFGLLCCFAFGIATGLFYRISAVGFWLLFTYVELLDKTYYLNHYYLVSALVFWLAIVPAHRFYALDTLIFSKIRSRQCYQWQILIFKVQLTLVYFYAGLAKINPDWMLRAEPMSTWLPGKYQLPIIGQLMHYKATAFILSWGGCFYDLFIWFFLWLKKTRAIAYLFVIVFHVLTVILFPRIGMFPYIMIMSTIIFFSSSWHQKVINYLPFSTAYEHLNEVDKTSLIKREIVSIGLILFVFIQLLLPLRYLFYKGNLFWTEKGYRFSWRVMLMEKNGSASIIVKDPQTGIQKEVDQREYLTDFQRQQMKTQPDMLLQFSRHIGDLFKKKNGYAPQVFVKSRHSLNGRRSQEFTNDTVDVYQASQSLLDSNWILPLR